MTGIVKDADHRLERVCDRVTYERPLNVLTTFSGKLLAEDGPPTGDTTFPESALRERPSRSGTGSGKRTQSDENGYLVQRLLVNVRHASPLGRVAHHQQKERPLALRPLKNIV